LLKKLYKIAAFTGVAHISALFSISVAARYVDSATLGTIGVIDSALLLATAIISFGLQVSTTRNIAIHKEWEDFYSKAQSARFTLSILLFLIGLIMYFFTKAQLYWVFVFSPIVALNGDYALYGHGLAIKASSISLVRVVIPSITLMLLSVYHSSNLILYYFLALFIGIAYAGISCAKTLNVKYVYSFNKGAFKLYLNNLKIGVATVSLTMMTSGLLYIANSFYSLSTIGHLYPTFRVYLILKGIRRIFIQAFFKDIANADLALRLDKLGIICGFSLLTSVSIYPGAVSNVLYGSFTRETGTILIILSASSFLSFSMTSAENQLLLKNKDSIYMKLFLYSALISILTCIVFSKTLPEEIGIPVSILIGEICFFLFSVKTLGGLSYYKDRLLFSLSLIWTLPLAYIPSLIIGDNIQALCMATILLGIANLLYNKKMLYEN